MIEPRCACVQLALPLEQSLASGLNADGEATNSDAALAALRRMCAPPPPPPPPAPSPAAPPPPAPVAPPPAGPVLSESDRLRACLLYLIHRGGVARPELEALQEACALSGAARGAIANAGLLGVRVVKVPARDARCVCVCVCVV